MTDCSLMMQPHDAHGVIQLGSVFGEYFVRPLLNSGDAVVACAYGQVNSGKSTLYANALQVLSSYDPKIDKLIIDRTFYHKGMNFRHLDFARTTRTYHKFSDLLTTNQSASNFFEDEAVLSSLTNVYPRPISNCPGFDFFEHAPFSFPYISHFGRSDVVIIFGRTHYDRYLFGVDSILDRLPDTGRNTDIALCVQPFVRKLSKEQASLKDNERLICFVLTSADESKSEAFKHFKSAAQKYCGSLPPLLPHFPSKPALAALC